jgi:YD repeat-containing protein
MKIRPIVIVSAALLLAAAAGFSADEIVPNRTAPAFIPAPAVPTAEFSAAPTNAEIGAVRAFEELLVPMSGTASVAENRALAKALAAYQAARIAAGPSNSMDVDLSAFEKFLHGYPNSIWRVSLLTNMGIEHYRRGEFTQALNAWQSAWQVGRSENSPRGRAIVDRALGELARMQARLGRVADLQALVAEAGDRKVAGLGAESYLGARGGLWNMLHKPEESFKCGPWALDSILTAANPAHPYRQKLRVFPSTDHGVSMAVVAALAQEMKMDLVPAHRGKTGESVPTPAVVHWKLGHYGALLRHEGDRYLLQDPTFGGHSQWISQAALDAEASGNFLVPAGALKDGGSWQSLTVEETKKIWGKGNPSGYPPPDYPSFADGFRDEVAFEALGSRSTRWAGSEDGSPSDDRFSDGLISASVDEISGVPQPADPPQPSGNGPGTSGPDDNIFGTPPDPPPFVSPADVPTPEDERREREEEQQIMQAEVDRYNQMYLHDHPQAPGGMAMWGMNLSEVDLRLIDMPLFYDPPVGPRIRFWVAYEQREANQPATLSFANFGNKWNFNWITTLTFDSNNAYVSYGESGLETFANFTAATQTSGVATISHTRLVRAAPNVFQLIAADGSMKVFSVFDGSGRYYMSKVLDALGNAVSLAYDNQYRLITITDALGQISVLSYTLAADPLKITKITDPFARTALFDYNASNQLVKITDAEGMTSQFTYGTGDFVNALITGYGTTGFNSTENGLDRTLVITLPDGSQEMAQSLGSATAGISFSDPAAKVPQGMPVDNGFLGARNTSFWDRKAMLEAPGDPSKARIYHYMHANNLLKGPILESVKLPFENRVWFYYQGQQQPGFNNTDGLGMLDTPSLIGRVMDDGSTQLFQNSYNTLGHLTQATDPVGRTRRYLYDTNNIDLLEVQQATGVASEESLGHATYNAQHQRLVATDAAGQQTRMTYNAAGQRLTLKDAKNQTTTYIYDANGYLQSVSGPLAGNTAQTSYTYDAYGRVTTETDALGYTRTFAYDKLNRLTSVTYPDATKVQYTYTLLDVTRYTDRLNRDTNYTYDSLRQRNSRTDPLNRTTRYHYSPCGKLDSLIDPLGQTTRVDYDVQSRPTAIRYADGSKTAYTYEATTSRLQSKFDAKGQTTFYQHNPDNRLKLIGYNNAQTPTADVRFTYDSSYPRVTSMIDGTGATNYSYYPVESTPVLGAGRLAAVQGPFGNLTYGYDELGRMSTRNVDGTGETRNFNLLSAVTSESNALGAFSYSYVANTREVASITLPNGQSTAFSYFPNTGDRLISSILHKRSGGSTLSQWGYTYNAQRHIVTWTQQRDSNPARVFTFGYDSADQVTSVGVTNPTATYGYSYDIAANRSTETINAATTSATYNSLNEISNLSTSVESDRTYEWDAADRLVAINYTGTSNRSEFTRDGLGRCVQIVEKTGATVTSTRRFLWNGSFLAEEKDGSGQTTKRFFSQGVKLVDGSAAGNYFYARDHLGSIRELTDTAGTIRARYDYDPYGRRTELTGDLDTDLGFAARYLHAPSALSLGLTRAYDPNLARWLTRTPFDLNPSEAQQAHHGHAPHHP